MPDCDKMLERANANRKAYRDRLHARGLCIRCRQPLEPERAGKMLCAACADYDCAAHRARYHRLKNDGVCVSCGKRMAAKGRTLCKPCLFDRAARQQMIRDERREKNNEMPGEESGAG